MLILDEFAVNLLLEDGRLTADQVAEATKQAAASRTTVTAALVKAKVLTAKDFALARAVVSEVPYVDLDHYEVDVQVGSLLPRSLADKIVALPLFLLGKAATVAMADPLDLSAVDRLRGALRVDVLPVLAEAEQLRLLIDRTYSLMGSRSIGAAAEIVVESGGKAAELDPIIAAVNSIITRAVEEGASDVHLSPDETEMCLRYRIDGILVVRQGPPLSNHPALVQRLKVMSNLDLTQSRRPQDGKFRFPIPGHPVDVRVSIIPTVYGENVVLRLLSGSTGLRGIEHLGLAPEVCTEFTALVQRAHGMLLATGPTGSGKTTTLYTAMRELNTPGRHCVTIEDPVEIRLPLVRHVQVNIEIGLTFASSLRAILRQDPDVILVGEIRDEETARIAVQSALTGHMVLSTLHTNDAPGAIARLMDFQCPAFALNAALSGVLGQRLVRRVCGSCAAACSPEESLLHRFCPRDTAGQFRAGKGCPQCSGSGYRGRIGVYELMSMTGTIRQAIEKHASAAMLRKLAVRGGMKPMWADGADKARLGLTTLDEIARIASGMDEQDVESDDSGTLPSDPARPDGALAAGTAVKKVAA